MSSNPFENEPGFENANSSEDKKQQAQYVAKVLFDREKRLHNVDTPPRSGMKPLEYRL